jgi:hypothetical protein
MVMILLPILTKYIIYGYDFGTRTHEIYSQNHLIYLNQNSWRFVEVNLRRRRKEHIRYVAFAAVKINPNGRSIVINRGSFDSW